MQIELGKRMKELRHRDGRTQEDLARALGVTSQAVSRWEKGICYPDMELIPALANFFGVAIDELFGYQNGRAEKIEALANRIDEMNRQNNGKDVCMDECIRLAREGLAEFPGNERIMLCLASALYNAGYVRYGEYHLTDEEGYDGFDTERHRTYAEWQEAIKLYEKLLHTLEEGELRHRAVIDLIQLYVNLGETEKAAAIAATAPTLSGCRELLMANTCVGRKRAEAYGKALLATAKTLANLIVSVVIVKKHNLKPEDAVQAVQNAIRTYDLVCTDGKYGLYHGELISLYLYLSEQLWLAGDRDGAFAALYTALEHAKAYSKVCEQEEIAYTAPLLSSVTVRPGGPAEEGLIAGLPDDWPWWFDADHGKVAAEIKADPRWEAWVKETQRA